MHADTGVSLGLERVPFAQKMLVRRAISKGKVAMTRIVVESMSWCNCQVLAGWLLMVLWEQGTLAEQCRSE